MAIDDARPCPCGSGLTSRWANDAKGIPHPPQSKSRSAGSYTAGQFLPRPATPQPDNYGASDYSDPRLASAGISFCAQSVWAYRKSIPFPGLSYRRVDDPYGQAADEVKLV
jgi:hypothetical protein